MSPARQLVIGSVCAGALLALVYLLAGGASYAPTPVADPCAPREWRNPQSVEESAEQFTLSALDGAACEIGVSREELAIALTSESGRERLAKEHGIDEAELDAAVHAGLARAIDDAQAAGALSPLVAVPLRAAVDQLPVDQAIALIEDASKLFEAGSGLLDQLGI